MKIRSVGKVRKAEFRKEQREHPTFTKKQVEQIIKDHKVADLKKAPEGWIQRPNKDEWQFWKNGFIMNRMAIEKVKSGGYRVFVLDESSSGGITKSEPVATKIEARNRANKFKRIISGWHKDATQEELQQVADITRDRLIRMAKSRDKEKRDDKK